MISTPETGVDSIAVTYALLDPIMTAARPLAAFFTASVTGLLVNMFDREPAGNEQLGATLGPGTVLPMAQVPSHHQHYPDGVKAFPAGASSRLHNAWSKLRTGMQFSFGNLLNEIGGWLLIGIVLAALITVFVSPEFIHDYLGNGLFSMLVMIALATPLYVCATASTPIAAALALKGLSPGAALVFLLAGPATNMATITVVARLLGRKTAVIYVASIVVCSLFLGVAVNWLYFGMGLSVAGWVHQEHTDVHGWVHTVAAVVLLLLIAKPWILKQYARFFQKSGEERVAPRHHDHNHGCGCGH